MSLSLRQIKSGLRSRRRTTNETCPQYQGNGGAAIDYSNRQCDSSGSPTQKPDDFRRATKMFSGRFWVALVAFFGLFSGSFEANNSNFQNCCDLTQHVIFPVGQISLCGLSVHPSAPYVVRARAARPSSVSGLPLKASISSTFSSLSVPRQLGQAQTWSGRSFSHISRDEVKKLQLNYPWSEAK